MIKIRFLTDGCELVEVYDNEHIATFVADNIEKQGWRSYWLPNGKRLEVRRSKSGRLTAHIIIQE